MPDTELSLSQLVLEIKDYRTDFTKARELVAAALSDARAEAYEECAQYFEGRSCFDKSYLQIARDIRDHARKLAEAGQGGENDV